MGVGRGGRESRSLGAPVAVAVTRRPAVAPVKGRALRSALEPGASVGCVRRDMLHSQGFVAAEGQEPQEPRRDAPEPRGAVEPRHQRARGSGPRRPVALPGHVVGPRLSPHVGASPSETRARSRTPSSRSGTGTSQISSPEASRLVAVRLQLATRSSACPPPPEHHRRDSAAVGGRAPFTRRFSGRAFTQEQRRETHAQWLTTTTDCEGGGRCARGYGLRLTPASSVTVARGPAASAWRG